MAQPVDLLFNPGTSMALATDSGRQREANEDAALVIPDLGVMLVCDGMGGHRAGSRASREAIDAFVTYLNEDRLGRAHSDPNSTGAILGEACREADRCLRRLSEGDESLCGMGSTAVVAHIGGDRLSVAHVGDSRAYLCREHLDLLTEDHSHVMRLVKAGQLSLEDLRTHPDGSWIEQALGGGKAISPTCRDVDLLPGDRILLCTDGLWEMVQAPRIEEIVKGCADPEEGCKALVEEANAAGGEDNITVCLYFHAGKGR